MKKFQKITFVLFLFLLRQRKIKSQKLRSTKSLEVASRFDKMNLACQNDADSIIKKQSPRPIQLFLELVGVRHFLSTNYYPHEKFALHKMIVFLIIRMITVACRDSSNLKQLVRISIFKFMIGEVGISYHQTKSS